MSHVLDTDGVSSHLFHFLAKETRKLSAARVFIPSTVIFDHGFASAWYFSTPSMEIKRRNVKNINMQDVFNEFTAGGQELVATFVELSSSRRAEAVVTSYYTKDDLREFLFSPGQRPRGVLQQFEYPKCWCNTAIQVVWSPTVAISEAVHAPHSLSDRTKTATERCATFDSKVPAQMAMTNSVQKAVRQVCDLVVGHIQQVEYVTVQGMVLQLKVTAANRVVLLFSTSLRVAQRGVFADREREPLNLAQRFVSDEEHRTAIELKRYLELYGKRQEADAKRSATTEPRGKAKRKLSPLSLASSGVSPAREKQPSVYKQRMAACSELIVPTFVASAIKMGNRWMPGRAAKPTKLAPLRAATPPPYFPAQTDSRQPTPPNREQQLSPTSPQSRDVSPIPEQRDDPDPTSQAVSPSTQPLESANNKSFAEEEAEEKRLQLRDAVRDLMYDVTNEVLEQSGGRDTTYCAKLCGCLAADIAGVMKAFAGWAPETFDLEERGATGLPVWPIGANAGEEEGAAVGLQLLLPFMDRKRVVAQVRVRVRNWVGSD
jgi:hypothetical protein